MLALPNVTRFQGLISGGTGKQEVCREESPQRPGLGGSHGEPGSGSRGMLPSFEQSSGFRPMRHWETQQQSFGFLRDEGDLEQCASSKNGDRRPNFRSG